MSKFCFVRFFRELFSVVNFCCIHLWFPLLSSSPFYPHKLFSPTRHSLCDFWYSIGNLILPSPCCFSPGRNVHVLLSGSTLPIIIWFAISMPATWEPHWAIQVTYDEGRQRQQRFASLLPIGLPFIPDISLIILYRFLTCLWVILTIRAMRLSFPCWIGTILKTSNHTLLLASGLLDPLRFSKLHVCCLDMGHFLWGCLSVYHHFFSLYCGLAVVTLLYLPAFHYKSFSLFTSLFLCFLDFESCPFLVISIFTFPLFFSFFFFFWCFSLSILLLSSSLSLYFSYILFLLGWCICHRRCLFFILLSSSWLASCVFSFVLLE